MEVIGLILVIGYIASMCISFAHERDYHFFNDYDVKSNQKRFISKRKSNPPMPRTLTNERKNNN